MLSSLPAEYLSAASRERLASAAKDEMVLDDGFVRTFTPFSTAEDTDVVIPSDETIAAMRAEIVKALDRLDRIVVKVLQDRKQAEKSAMTWIAIGGGLVVSLVVAAVIAPFVIGKQIPASIFSTLPVAGLTLLLYSPVRKTLNIANDRANLILMVQGFRLQFAVADTIEQLQELASELTAALRLTSREDFE